MTLDRRYWVGVAAVAAAALLLSFVVPPDIRTGLRFATALALPVQAPLGWGVVRAVGTERLQLIWAVGMAARLALVVVCALVVAPRLGLGPESLLPAVVGVLMSFVMVEAIVVRPETKPT